ncbi:MAG TPA: adenylate/guanylate cyclase domain-containing protein [Mycobacterium sp.]
MTTVELACSSCGTALRTGAKFCDECGAPTSVTATAAEYKQATVLFADVVHSMDIAAAVGAERLREIMADLVNRCAVVVHRYGGTVDKFTGDGIMALFGAPMTLEDHAFRACLAALEIQQAVQRLPRIDLQLRIGLNSGQVIAGEIGSGLAGYTAIGEQVGIAQRMESVAPPGGVMLSESTARLVEGTVVLADRESVHVKGIHAPISARRLLAIGDRRHLRRSESALVGRTWEVSTLSAILDEVVAGSGCVVNVVGPAGIGKSRLVREAAAIAAQRGIDTFAAYCESHTRDIPFYAVARLLRAATGIDDLDAAAARARIRERVPEADPQDLLLFDDLLGIRDPRVPLPDVAPDARDRRLTALVNAASLAREEPAVYVIEDAHWIDEVSEMMVADLLTVIPQTPSLVLLTYRPDYDGILSRVSGAQTLALRPLSESQTAALATELLGSDPSVRGMADLTAARAAGNPFFVEEIVRDLAERGVVAGGAGAYVATRDLTEETVPPTVQATIGARIDRLPAAAKRTVQAAAVVGLRFDDESLVRLVDQPDVSALLDAELIEQVKFTPRAEYAFRHALIRAVAYESQLKSERANLHRQLASSIEQRDENAPLIAEHLEAAGDLRAAFDWHMRAGTWFTNRSIDAAQTSWGKARSVADRLPEGDPHRMPMRIAPRTLMCGTAWRTAGSGAELGFEELRELCDAAGDKRSLAIGMSGAVVMHFTKAQRRAGSQLASELMALLESVDDPTLTLALTYTALVAKHDTGEVVDMLGWAERAIDAADGDPTKGDLIIGSPLGATLTLRGLARWCLGVSGWRDDFRAALDMVRPLDPMTRSGLAYFAYTVAIANGVTTPDATVLAYTSELLPSVEQMGDNIGLSMARTSHGVVLIHRGGPEQRRGAELLAQVRDEVVNDRYSFAALPIIESEIARVETAFGQLDAAVERARVVVGELFDSGGCLYTALACSALVEALLARGSGGDLAEAESVVHRFAAVPTDPGFVLNKITLLRLRAMLAGARGDANYQELVERYRAVANELGFEGHSAWAEAIA